jgi:hypothetical protein
MVSVAAAINVKTVDREKWGRYMVLKIFDDCNKEKLAGDRSIFLQHRAKGK